jgi:hypothetical protein
MNGRELGQEGEWGPETKVSRKETGSKEQVN